jgi:hypothetical protein
MGLGSKPLPATGGDLRALTMISCSRKMFITNKQSFKASLLPIRLFDVFKTHLSCNAVQLKPYYCWGVLEGLTNVFDIKSVQLKHNVLGE